jgi:4-carboxymuconolactone decarboxylase
MALFDRWHRRTRGVRRSGMCIIAASVAAASGRMRLLDEVVARSRTQRLPRVSLEEALLQVYLFAGYPRAIEALLLLARTWPARDRSRPVARSLWRRRGTELCRVVYGHRYERMQASIRAAHPDLAAWMIEEGYGKVLSRSGLQPAQRELCAVAVLAAIAAPRQLRAHVRGALNAGAPPEEIAGAVRLAALGCGLSAWRKARRVAVAELKRDEGRR